LIKKTIYILGFILLVGGILGYNYYQKIFGTAITKEYVLFVNSSDSLVDIKEKIKDYSKNPNTFLWVAAKKNFSKLKTGRYILKVGMSNNDLVNLLRSGNQTPLKISFNNQDTLEKFAGRIAEQLEIDSTSIINSFTEKQFLDRNNFTKKSVLQICIPNTYEFYWTISADKFRNRLLKEYNRFWNASRLAKAKALKLSKEDVITLASIVQKETAKEVERPIVAGLYLNRLKNGWPLQADPTIIFAKQQQEKNIVIKRVLFKYIEDTKDSPYNTYKKRGLPPTLIGMPDISSIDGVLNAQKHDYFYMCVNIEKFGYHKFAKSLAQHNRNRTKYQKWLNKKGIKR
jgi:UPF0755 protein